MATKSSRQPDQAAYPDSYGVRRRGGVRVRAQDEGGCHVYAPELPGLRTRGDTLDEATENAREALALYVEGLREDGRSLEMGIVRRR